MIDLHRVSKSFGSFNAVSDVSLSIHPGQCVGLLGPNGSGKTTTIRMITGYFPPSSGRVSINGRDTIGSSLLARRTIGYLPETTPLYPEMRVVEYLSYRARLYSVPRSDRRRAIGRSMSLCRINDVARRRIGQLSKGYKQRVGLAGCMIHDPPVLVLDEPTSGLDPSQIRETRSLIKDLAAERTVLVSSHILPEIEQTCDRVVIIARGRIRADGTPAELVRRTDTLSQYILEVRLESDRVASAIETLRQATGAATITAETLLADPGWQRLTLTAPPNSPDQREPIAQHVSAMGIAWRELRQVVPTLEHVFMQVIESDAGVELTRDVPMRGSVQ